MTLKLISSVKNGFLACCNHLRDVSFPPYCVACKEPCQTKWFCLSCWMFCVPPDPSERCPHCFKESEGLCKECKKNPYLSFAQGCVFENTHLVPHLQQMEKKTLAAFAIRAWVNLDWPIPDVILPMSGSYRLARFFSEMLNCPMMSDVDAIEEDQILLVLNENASLQECKEAIAALGTCSPKRGYLLHLFEIE